MKKKPKPFSHILVDHLLDNYQDKSFSSITLEEFGKKHGKNRNAISQVLRNMKSSGKLEIVGKIPPKNGGDPAKIYKLADVECVEVKIEESKESKFAKCRRLQKLKEQRQNEACLRLCKALDIMTVSR